MPIETVLRAAGEIAGPVLGPGKDIDSIRSCALN
jgi:hypothetical protein